jgi:hypothetical protein
MRGTLPLPRFIAIEVAVELQAAFAAIRVQSRQRALVENGISAEVVEASDPGDETPAPKYSAPDLFRLIRREPG